MNYAAHFSEILKFILSSSVSKKKEMGEYWQKCTSSYLDT